MKEPPITPLMTISLSLTIGIIVAKLSYDDASSRLWLVGTILTWSCALIAYLTDTILRRNHTYSLTKKSKFTIQSQCITLHLCILCLGGTFTAREISQEEIPTEVVAYNDLSLIDRCTIQAKNLKEHLEKEIQSHHIDQQDFAVISAMALGDKSALNAETKESYSISGASHILAISGLHIGIIFQLFILLLGGKRSSTIGIILSTTAIWAYLFLIGFPASATRAATMISIYSFCSISWRNNLPFNALAAAYVFLLLYNPLSLFDIGFQMSFLAVGSVLLFYPYLFNLLNLKNTPLRWAWALTCVSLSAQIGTLPIVIYYFGRIPCYTLLTNFIAIPAATIILYSCLALFLLSAFTLLPYCTGLGTTLMELVARLLNGVTQLANMSLKSISMLPGASIEQVNLNLLQVVCLYVCILGVYAFGKKYHELFLSKKTNISP